MNCSDVMCLARAAPEPASSSRVSARDSGDSFDQFLKVETPETFSKEEKVSRSKTSNREETKSTYETSQKEKTEPKQVDEKPVEKTESQASTDAVGEEETIKEALAAAVAAQVLNVVLPTDVPKDVAVKSAAGEANVPAGAVPAQQSAQTPVIQLPETEPQPLPDELKQAVQQPKVEVKDFQTLVDAAAKNLETQAAQTTEPVVKTAVETPEIKNLGAKEPVVKVVDLKATPEDMDAIQATRANGGLYAMSAVKSENLIQPKTLPMIHEISQEVVNLAREQGKSLRIQVHPENLGKIDLRLISNSDGLRILMTTEIPATAKLLETHLDHLQRSLAESGLSISGMSVNSQTAQDQANNPSSKIVAQGSNKNFRPTLQEEPSETQRLMSVNVSVSGLDYRI